MAALPSSASLTRSLVIDPNQHATEDDRTVFTNGTQRVMQALLDAESDKSFAEKGLKSTAVNIRSSSGPLAQELIRKTGAVAH